MSIADFISQHNNQALDWDGAYGAQCVDLVQYWAQANGWPTFSGNAIDIAGQTHNFYSWVPNSPDGVPPAGAIIVWGQYAPHGITSAGHIAVATGTGDTNSFDSFDQNWPEGSACHVQHHDYGGVLGWLVTPNNQGEQEVIIPDQDNWYGRFNKLTGQIRGRGLSRDEFQKNFVGQEAFRMVESLSDNSEADAALDAQNIGQTAVRDNWQGQITDLTAKNVQLSDLNQQLQKQVDQDQAQSQTTPPPPAPSSASDNSITVTKDGLWAKVKAFLGL